MITTDADPEVEEIRFAVRRDGHAGRLAATCVVVGIMVLLVVALGLIAPLAGVLAGLALIPGTILIGSVTQNALRRTPVRIAADGVHIDRGKARQLHYPWRPGLRVTLRGRSPTTAQLEMVAFGPGSKPVTVIGGQLPADETHGRAIADAIERLRADGPQRTALAEATASHCTQCGYALAGLPPGQPCPECGNLDAGNVMLLPAIDCRFFSQPHTTNESLLPLMQWPGHFWSHPRLWGRIQLWAMMAMFNLFYFGLARSMLLALRNATPASWQTPTVGFIFRSLPLLLLTALAILFLVWLTRDRDWPFGRGGMLRVGQKGVAVQHRLGPKPLVPWSAGRRWRLQRAGPQMWRLSAWARSGLPWHAIDVIFSAEDRTVELIRLRCTEPMEPPVPPLPAL